MSKHHRVTTKAAPTQEKERFWILREKPAFRFLRLLSSVGVLEASFSHLGIAHFSAKRELQRTQTLLMLSLSEQERLKKLLIQRQLSVEFDALSVLPPSESASKDNASVSFGSAPPRQGDDSLWGTRPIPLLHLAFTRVLSTCPLCSKPSDEFWAKSRELYSKLAPCNVGWLGDISNARRAFGLSLLACPLSRAPRLFLLF